MPTPPPAPVTANPYLDQYSTQMSQWGGDSALAFNGQNSNNLGTLQQQQTQLLGNGGVGYTAGGGNDTSGSNFSQANPWAVSSQGQSNPIQDLAQTQTNNQSAYTPPSDVSGSASSPGLYSAHVMGSGYGGANSYPTYPNQYSLGSQTGMGGMPNGTDGGSLGTTPGGGQYGAASTFNSGAFQAIEPQKSSANPYQGDAQAYYPSNSGPMPSSTTGFNPWSMTGEANSRIM